MSNYTQCATICRIQWIIFILFLIIGILFFRTKFARRHETAAPVSRIAIVLRLLTNTEIKFRGLYLVSPFGCRVPACLVQKPPSRARHFVGPTQKKIRGENQRSNFVFCPQTGLSESHCLVFWPRDIRVPGAQHDGSYNIAH